MKKYEKEVIQSFLDNEDEVIAKLKATYAQSLKDVDEKIEAFMSRPDADMQHVIYQVEYQKALRKQIAGILDELHANEFETISEYLVKCYHEGFSGAMYSLQQQGIPLCFPIDQEAVANAVQLDSKISKGLYTSVGEDVADLKKKIAAEVSRGVATGASYSQVAKQIKNHMVGAYTAKTGGALYRANLIARTEGHRVQVQSAMDACYKARDKGADVVKQWNATIDSKTRDSHWAVHNQVRELDEKFSNGLMFPSDPAGGAAEVCNCRCALLQRGRWNLGEDETQMLGDVSEMDDKTKERVAQALHVPVDELEQYSKSIVPINAKDYEDFKRQYSKIWHYEGSDIQKEAEARIAGYKAKRKTSSERNRMATSEKSNDWSKAVARTVTPEEKGELIQYATNKGVKIVSMKGFDGDPELLRAEIDTISAATKKYNLKKPINLNVKVLDDDADFAETHEHNITINAKALRNREITERNIVSGGQFASKTVEDIALHEVGHVIAFEKGNIGLEITKEAYYNVTGKAMSTKEAIKFLDGISQYATDLSDENSKKKHIKPNKYTEIIPEVIVSDHNVQTEFTTEFVRLLIER